MNTLTQTFNQSQDAIKPSNNAERRAGSHASDNGTKLPDTNIQYACSVVRADGYCPQIDSQCPHFANLLPKGYVIEKCDDWLILETRRMR